MEISLNKEELIDLETFCSLNGLNVYDFTKKCYICGFHIEKYGLLGEEKKVSDPVETIELKNKISELESKLELSLKKRKMLEETILSLKTELSNFK